VKTESLYSSHRKLRICLLLYVTVWVLYCDFLQRLEFSARIAECHPGLFLSSNEEVKSAASYALGLSMGFSMLTTV